MRSPPAAATPMRLLRIWFLPLSVLLLSSAALVVPLPLFLEEPGEPLPLAAAISVEAPAAAPVDGDYLLLAVTLQRATTAGWLEGLIEADAAILPAWQVVPPGQRSAAFFDRQRHVFDESGVVAAAVGLEAAGYDVDPPPGGGARVVRVVAGTPADGALLPGDVIVAAGDEPIRSAEDLRAEITEAGASTIAFTVERGEDEVTVEIVPAAVSGVPDPIIGVEPETVRGRIELPVDVTVEGGRTGGPSGGLMIALTVYDKVSPEVDLADGRVIAGTGSLTLGGEVGPVGGTGLKVLSADRDGADVFLAPAAQVEEARAALPAGSAMEVVGVATFAEAVAALGGPT